MRKFDYTRQRKITILAYPLVLASLTQTLLNIVDAIMIGHLNSPAALASVSLGGLIVITFGVSMIGFAKGIQALVSRRYGEGNLDACGIVMRNGLLLGFGVGLTVSVVFNLFGAQFFHFINNDPDVIRMGAKYMQIRFWSLPFFGAMIAIRGFFVGVGVTRIAFVAAVMQNICNVIVNYLLIFGVEPFPRLEVTGAAIGSAASNVVGLTIFICYSMKPKFRETYQLYKRRYYDPVIMKSIVKLSAPAVFQHFINLVSYLTFQSIVGIVGTVDLAASHISMQIFSLGFLPSIGLGQATAALVGQSLGARKPDEAEAYTYTSVKMGLLIIGAVSISFLTVPGFYAHLFTEEPEVVQKASMVMQITAITTLFNTANILFGNAIQGAGNTQWVMGVTVLTCLTVFLPGAYLLAIVMNLGLMGAWLGNLVYIVITYSAMHMKFKEGSWKHIEI